MFIPGSMKLLITVMAWLIIQGSPEARAEKMEPESSAVSASRSAGMIADTFQSPDWKKDFYYYAPKGDSVTPLILFGGALNAGGPHEYEELIVHLVGRGNSVLYAPARRATLTRNKLVKYDLGMSGITEAVHHWKQIDTSRIAVIGHGFGGGAAPALMRMVRLKKWGEKGALLYILAPWYLYSIDKREMQAFPKGVTLVVQSFERDYLNDPHIAADIFSLLGVPADKKVYLRTGDFNNGGQRIRADFTAPMGDNSVTDAWNNLDRYGVVRMVDCAFDYAFNRDTAKTYQSLGAMIDAVTGTDSAALHLNRPFITRFDRPLDSLPRGIWINQWNSPRNPRLDANIIRKGRKTYFRYRAKRMRQVTRYLAKEVKATLGRDDTTDIDVINPIDSGFGADGTFKVAVKHFPNPVEASMSVSFFYPDRAPGHRPLILFLHGYNNGDTAYFSHLIHHIVSNGFALVFSPYPTFPTVDSEKPVMEKYTTALAGFEEAVKRFQERVDTARIGIFGQSFGAGAVPWVAKKVMNERAWGKDAAFLFISAPWYTFGMSQEDFEAIPKHVKLLLTTYDDDVFNDHQVAVDIFRSVRVPADEKSFITFMSDTLDSVILSANHFVPYSAQSVNGVIDNFDFFGIFKLFDALAAYTVTGDKEGKIVALGKGNEEQCYMGVWPDGSPVTPAVVSTDPHPRHETLQYVFSWENKLNPRREAQVSPLRKRLEKRRIQRAKE
jgi:acetyl esterase/lipase